MRRKTNIMMICLNEWKTSRKGEKSELVITVHIIRSPWKVNRNITWLCTDMWTSRGVGGSCGPLSDILIQQKLVGCRVITEKFCAQDKLQLVLVCVPPFSCWDMHCTTFSNISLTDCNSERGWMGNKNRYYNSFLWVLTIWHGAQVELPLLATKVQLSTPDCSKLTNEQRECTQPTHTPHLNPAPPSQLSSLALICPQTRNGKCHRTWQAAEQATLIVMPKAIQSFSVTPPKNM